MAEQNPFEHPTDSAATGTSPRRRFDPLSLVAGLAALGGTGYVFLDGPAWIGHVDPRWLIAGIAVLIGVGMLAASLRKDR
ncbi:MULTISPECIES: hypothetical protein [Prauserella salsuginis group]|uniref:Uncharacterized protein n=2 Tax=Prauserella salsuginis group TaxID=2893672 RepID=A0A839XFL9_9PSEU|nr:MULTISPECIES: hypothetical protein [Prauserella salsuginis group]MBB3662060.1 hypothetical protein [Prauserella sediminis]MCR3719753.1 hypothetical protein [Prauserella flava]MCR3736704.1 hypothetical protein [Prauserella salsuginis]